MKRSPIALPFSCQPKRPVALRGYLAIKDVQIFHAIPGLPGDFALNRTMRFSAA
jgi:hypothetical protein